ncbi:MAG: hypothetical protein GXY83_23310 [Rhodopirellula sp.]|nr:hypothetical protein [Rhodopirellula sp.]
MRCVHRIELCILATIAFSGCGAAEDAPAAKSPVTAVGNAGGAATPSEVALSPPAAATKEFLEAVRTGDDEKAAAMLTDLARTKTAEQQIQVAPRGSDTAKYEIGKVEMLTEGGARVAATWTDLDHTGQPQTNQMLWMLRKEDVGWRIAGIAAEVFAGEPPLLLDFEKPEETLEKLQQLHDEVQRRAKAEISPPQQAEQPGDSVRR